MQILTPSNWKEYELIDTGGSEKLERFGKYVLARPEPQAVWQKSLPEKEWEQLAHGWYKRTRGIDPSKQDLTEKGEWKRKSSMPDQWVISYSYKEMNLKFRLGLTSFGHIGVFPEQAVNWDAIYDLLAATNDIRHTTNVLNLFAYTGGSSLAARAARADVIHVDSVKPVVNWAREDMELSGLDGIRWVVEDALKFVKREVKRGHKYNGIILDPPAYGRGPEGEKWILQDSVDEMIGCCSQLLEPENSFVIFSMYSMGFSALIAENLVRSHFGNSGEIVLGEMYLPDRAGRKLPLGTFLKLVRE
ncbi:MAG: class I SAM-dependent methyltransferase [Bacteroidetes bacterium]|nr:class I SAM-dependent methyltransferase [Bacteroidota bacterium]